MATTVPASLGRSDRRGALTGHILGGVAIAALAIGLAWFADQRGALLGLAAVLVVAGSLWLAATRRTGLALALFMIYLGALDGYLKLATGSGVMTLLRDVLLFAIVAGLLVRAQVDGVRLAPPPLTGWVAVFAIVVLVQIANPLGGTFVHSLAGVRQHLEFVPLFFLTFAFVRTKEALRIFVLVLLVLAFANGVAGFMQFRLSPQEFAAWGPGYAERVLGQDAFLQSGRSFFDSEGNNFTRPFGLGSEAGSGGLLGALALGGVLALASLFTRPRYLLFAGVMAIGAIAAIVTSQGRAVLLCSFVVVLAFGLLTATSRGRLASLLGVAAAGLVTLLVIQAVIGGAGTPALRYEGLGATQLFDTTSQARGESLSETPQTLVTYPLGAGLATAGPASRVGGGTELTLYADAENQLAFMTLETGIAGALLIIAFTVRIFQLGLSGCRREPDRETRVLLAAIIAPVAGLLAMYIPSAITATTPGGPYLWAAGGIASYWFIAKPRADAARGAPPDVL